jgi:crotonobetainyl-CoA:carnitine CoA-transferase CaiB-like acyl-CoA transferase
VREHQFARLAQVVGRPEWADDPRFATRAGWGEHLEDVIRPGVEAWATTRSKLDAARELTAAGVAAGPCYDAAEVMADPHLRGRHMLSEVGDGALVPGNPVKLSAIADQPDGPLPDVGQHTVDVLRDELGLSDDDVAALISSGVIAVS